MRSLRTSCALATLALAVTACGATTTGHPARQVTSGGPPHLVTSHTWTAASYAAHLMSQVLVPPDSTRVTGPPSGRLTAPPAWPATYKHPYLLKHWWTLQGTPHGVYAWMRAHNSRLGKPAQGGDPLWLIYSVGQSSLPRTIGVGDVIVAVAPLGEGRVGIGVFALALHQLHRPPAEIVPVDQTVRVVVTWQRDDGSWQSRVLTGARAAALARDFDALRVSTLGTPPCMAPYGRPAPTASFKAGGRTWTVQMSSCPGLEVAQNGRSLPYLTPGNPFSADIAAITRG